MSNRTTLTSLVALAAVVVILGLWLHRVALKDANAYPRAFGVIAVRATGNRGCEVLNGGASIVYAQKGDKVTWLIVGRCPGHKIGLYNFRLLDPEPKDPTTKDAKEQEPVNAESGETIQLTLDPTVQGTFGYDVVVDPPPAPQTPQPSPTPPEKGPIMAVCPDWPCK